MRRKPIPLPQCGASHSQCQSVRFSFYFWVGGRRGGRETGAAGKARVWYQKRHSKKKKKFVFRVRGGEAGVAGESNVRNLLRGWGGGLSSFAVLTSLPIPLCGLRKSPHKKKSGDGCTRGDQCFFFSFLCIPFPRDCMLLLLLVVAVVACFVCLFVCCIIFLAKGFFVVVFGNQIRHCLLLSMVRDYRLRDVNTTGERENTQQKRGSNERQHKENVCFVVPIFVCVVCVGGGV